MTTEHAEETEELQQYLIVVFRVVRVFRGYLSRWLRDGFTKENTADYEDGSYQA
ncbi:MAG: hypothetical protein JNL58_17815 [Planctomyces sp.]|nr:hypothetical protein [Planctomyces sp.]